ncbi:Uncharacterised protein [Arcanobacterium haemolyticum]|nr:Uncharacterised protein [Arcanobacterium haemolyticum]
MTLHPTEIIFLFFRFTRIASSIRIPDYKKSVAILAATKDKAIENTAGRVKKIKISSSKDPFRLNAI